MRVGCEKKIHLNVYIGHTHKICQSPSISMEIIAVSPSVRMDAEEDSITHTAGGGAV